MFTETTIASVTVDLTLVSYISKQVKNRGMIHDDNQKEILKVETNLITEGKSDQTKKSILDTRQKNGRIGKFQGDLVPL